MKKPKRIIRLCREALREIERLSEEDFEMIEGEDYNIVAIKQWMLKEVLAHVSLLLEITWIQHTKLTEGDIVEIEKAISRNR